MNEPKRFKRESTILEYLPNELFVEIFGYLNGVDTVYAFSQLNIRFQCLTNDYVRNFNFKFVSKAKFDFITQLHNTHQWRSLCLSNGDKTPGQIKSFCQLFPLAEHINQIQSLAALNMTPKYAQEFLLQIGSFENLTSLSIGKICGLNIQSIELPSLKRLVLTSCKHTSWIMNFHGLENLQYTIKYSCSHPQQLVFPTKLTRLKIFYEDGRDGDAIRILLRQMSQLNVLALYNGASYSSLPNGQIWENLIASSLPLLTTFQFYFPFDSYRHSLDDFNQTIRSFSTPFYLFEKHWFIRCDRNVNNINSGALYSLPFAFSKMPINTFSFDESLSTLPASDSNETKGDYYTKITTLLFHQKCKEPHIGLSASSIYQLILTVNLPTSWLYLLSKLRHITIGSYTEMSPEDFQNLLQHSPNLQSLSISSDKLKKLTDKYTNPIICQKLSQQIRSLSISHNYMDLPNLGIVSVRALSSLVRIFSAKCEHLSLGLIAHPNTVRPILRRMKQLRSLHLEWRHLHLGMDDPVAYWLQQQSTGPRSMDYVHTTDNRHLFIWFGNRL